jgi:2-polyprenyl-6-methoxyphenol hydroxylase-like FAD-dependent oxidoreductase
VTSAPGRHAVVVGAGIGGLAAAAGLHHLGWRVTVLERAAAVREAGTGLSLLSNAQRALDQLGVGAALRARWPAMAPGGEGLRTRSGRRLQRPADPAFLREHGLTLIVLPRPELHRALRAALPTGCLHTGAEVTSVRDVPGGAAVSHSGPAGPRTVQGDVVVAADGASSLIRRTRWPAAPAPVYSGHSVWRGIAEGVDGRAEPGGSSWARGLEFGRMPMARDRVYWFAVANTPEGASYPDNHTEVLRRFGSWHHPIPALIAATPARGVLHHDVFELARPLSSYVSGRVALLGDAAHVMTSDLGQGACQALEDAVVLCAALASHADVPAALASYDEQRRPRTQAVAAASRRMGQFKLAERGLTLLRRNIMMRFSLPAAGQDGMASLGDWQPPVLPGIWPNDAPSGGG